MKYRKHLTYANVMATFAAFGVLAGGGAYAASKIRAKDIAKNAVTSRAVKAKSLRGTDLQLETLTGQQIREDTLALTDTGITIGAEGPNLPCDPGGALSDCGHATIELAKTSRVWAVATAGLLSEGGPARVECELHFDGQDDPAGVTYGEAAFDNTDGSAAHGFATNRVSDPLGPGAHRVALMCRETAGNAEVTNQEINAIAVPGN